jgi:hypothetical protein
MRRLGGTEWDRRILAIIYMHLDAIVCCYHSLYLIAINFSFVLLSIFQIP